MESSFDKDSMMNQAQHVWSMLDDMAENDPKAYRKFIDKQMQERKEFLSPAEPHMCVQTWMVQPQNVPFYINFCTWKRIPAPTNSEEPVKVAGSAIGHLKDDKGKAAVTAVAFNEKILSEFGREASSNTDQDTLIQIAMDFIEKQHSNIKLNRKYTILERTHKGSVKLIQHSLFQAFRAKDKDFNENLEDMLKDFAPLATESPEALLGQLNKDSQPASFAQSDSCVGEKLSGINLNTCPMKTGLIEEVASGETSSSLPEPVYELTTEEDQLLILKISLPEVRSVAECELDISKDDISLLVEDKYDLKLVLPQTIIDDEATAKFNKKTSMLVLRVPIAT